MDLAELNTRTPVYLQRKEAAFPDKFIAGFSSGIREKIYAWKRFPLIFCSMDGSTCVLFYEKRW